MIFSAFISCLSASELEANIRANGLGTFVVTDGSRAKAFIADHPSHQISLEFADANGSGYLRYADKGVTLNGPEDRLDVLTMSPLNLGRVEPGIGRYTDAVSKTSPASIDELFTNDSLFGSAREAERVAVVAATADAYLEDPEDRRLTKSASEIPLRYLSGEKMDRDDKGRLPMAMEVKEILFGYPQSYDFEESLRQHARAIKRVEPKPFPRTLSTSPRSATETVRSDASVKVKIVRPDGSIAEKYLRLEDMRANAVPVIPPRLIPTGNLYREPELEPFNYFRLPGHSVPGFDLNTFARPIFIFDRGGNVVGAGGGVGLSPLPASASGFMTDTMFTPEWRRFKDLTLDLGRDGFREF